MFSLPKLLLLAVIVAAVWLGFKLLKRRGLSGVFGGAGSKSGAKPAALEMEKCRICGDFVAAGSGACARTRCPYRAA